MTDAVQFAVRNRSSSEKAILFLHGFSGNAHDTFGMMPAFLAGDPSLSEWDIHCFGYPTSISPDITGVWAADPDLTELSAYFAQQLPTTYSRYQEIALIAHSMGGLIAQRGLLDCECLDKIRHVILFGAPSQGLRKASWTWFLKRQVRDMSHNGKFIRDLRSAWDSKFDPSKCTLAVVAGLRDQFVPPESSLDPFARTHHRRVDGNHLEIVKPTTASADSVRIVVSQLSPTVPSPASPLTNQVPATDNGLTAQNPIDTQKIADRALALEMNGEWKTAIQLLEQNKDQGLYLRGTLAGRYKRRWLNTLDEDEADDFGQLALENYHQGYLNAKNHGEPRPSAYLAINAAFMELGLNGDKTAALLLAEQAKYFAEKNDRGASWKWFYPTIAEALLHFNEDGNAVRLYRIAPAQLDPRERCSMFQQAIWTARLLGKESVEAQLHAMMLLGE